MEKTKAGRFNKFLGIIICPLAACALGILAIGFYALLSSDIKISQQNKKKNWLKELSDIIVVVLVILIGISIVTFGSLCLYCDYINPNEEILIQLNGFYKCP